MAAFRSCSKCVSFMALSGFRGVIASISTPGFEHPARHRVELLQQPFVARFWRRDQRGVERAVGADRARLVLAREILGQPRHKALGLVGVRHQHLDDVLHGDGVVVGMPAVVVGDHGDGRVANLRLARELRLRHVGHADHRIAEVLVGHALGIAGELRAFHAHIGAVAHHVDAFRHRRLGEMDAQPRRHGMRHRDVRDAALAEERALALVGAVDELVDQHKGAGRQFLLERAAGRQRHEIGDAGALERVDIGAVVDIGGRQTMALVVARQKHDRQPRNLTHTQRR